MALVPNDPKMSHAAIHESFDKIRDLIARRVATIGDPDMLTFNVVHVDSTGQPVPQLADTREPSDSPQGSEKKKVTPKLPKYKEQVVRLDMTNTTRKEDKSQKDAEVKSTDRPEWIVSPVVPQPLTRRI